jgi:hypothetical protein
MRASRKLIEAEPVIARSGLRLLRGSDTLPARKTMTKRDGRIRLMRENIKTDERPIDEPAVRRAHARLRLPSLEQWLSARLW